MRIIKAEIKKYNRVQKRKRSDGSKGEYKTSQYLITLKKEAVEDQHFENIKEASIVVPSELEELLTSDKQGKTELIKLQGELINYQNIQIEYDKLENQYKHDHQVLIKREKELSNALNEINYLKNRGIIETMLDKLRKKPAIESKENKEK